MLFGVPIGLVAVAPSAVGAPTLFAFAGAGCGIGDVAGRTLLQRVSPNQVLSRVFGVLEGLMMLALAIGSIVAAILIEVFDVQTALIVIGAFLPLVVLSSSGRLLSIDRRSEAPDPEILALLRHIPFFAPLPAPALERVMADVTRSEAPAGTVLIREGEPGDHFFVILDGEVSVSRGDRHVPRPGRERLRRRDRAPSRRPTDGDRGREDAGHLLSLEREAFLLAVTRHPQSREAAHAVAEVRSR